MSRSQATAEAFWTAFRALRKPDKQAVLRRLLEDSSLRRDMLDLAVIESRKREPSRPLREYLDSAT